MIPGEQGGCRASHVFEYQHGGARVFRTMLKITPFLSSRLSNCCVL